MSEECNSETRECEKKVVKKPKAQKLPLKDRKKGFSMVDLGFTAEEAIQEAQRCLSSQPCDSCNMCSLLCPDLCITKDATSGNVAIDLEYCKGCGICAAICPKGAIKMEMED
jgi:2-oxoacid:acceptor oxidoreductase delta subunit (pyruvate/2-ketoisovalerate family)